MVSSHNKDVYNMHVHIHVGTVPIYVSPISLLCVWAFVQLQPSLPHAHAHIHCTHTHTHTQTCVCAYPHKSISVTATSWQVYHSPSWLRVSPTHGSTTQLLHSRVPPEKLLWCRARVQQTCKAPQQPIHQAASHVHCSSEAQHPDWGHSGQLK